MNDTVRTLEKMIQAGGVPVLNDVRRDGRVLWEYARGGLSPDTSIDVHVEIVLFQEIGEQRLPDATVRSSDCNTH